MRIRRGRPEDAAAIADFNHRLARETEGRAPEAEVLRRGVARALARPELCRYFVAEVEGAIAGQAMVTYEVSDWRDGVFWWLQSVYVEPSMRRRGVFRALYRHIEDAARRDADARGIRLYVELENDVARAVYGKLGMREAGYAVLEDDWSGALS